MLIGVIEERRREEDKMELVELEEAIANLERMDLARVLV